MNTNRQSQRRICRIGFAVPVDTVNRIVPELIKHGKVDQARLGISRFPMRWRDAGASKGVIIGKVGRGSVAERVGLRGARETMGGRVELGDILVAVDGKPVGKPSRISWMRWKTQGR